MVKSPFVMVKSQFFLTKSPVFSQPPGFSGRRWQKNLRCRGMPRRSGDVIHWKVWKEKSQQEGTLSLSIYIYNMIIYIYIIYILYIYIYDIYICIWYIYIYPYNMWSLGISNKLILSTIKFSELLVSLPHYTYLLEDSFCIDSLRENCSRKPLLLSRKNCVSCSFPLNQFHWSVGSLPIPSMHGSDLLIPLLRGKFGDLHHIHLG